MSPTDKLKRVFSLNQMIGQLQCARITAGFGEMPDREMRLRLASLRLGRETMVKAFGWDPEEKGR